MSKRDLVAHFEDKQLLDRMRIFYGGPVGARRIQSKLVDPVEEDDLPSSVDALSKWKVSKIRKLLRDFIRDLGIKKKLNKLSARS